MIDFHRFVLKNGLRVVLHEDDSTPLVAVNMLYDVGSRDERPDRTGFAHLFEHLMFGGSKNAKDFDTPIQQAGGENNAFTNNDMTNFYATVPAENLETLLWLESDRMAALNINKRSLNVQRKVVVEEFSETVFNEPFGDVWHHIGALAFEQHPYRWPVIGLVPQHIEEASLEEVKAFYTQFYTPNNAILVVAGHFKALGGMAGVEKLVEKWFGSIPAGPEWVRQLPQETSKLGLKRKTVAAEVPVDALFMLFHAPSRLSPDYYAVDLLTDVLSSGASSRLYRRLLKEERLFSEIDCFQTGSMDPGLIVIEAKPSEGVALEAAEAAIWRELERLKVESTTELELQKLKNKVESQTAFGDAGVLNKAMNLAFYELLGHADLINTEVEQYNRVQIDDIQRLAHTLFVPDNCAVLSYQAKKTTETEAV